MNQRNHFRITAAVVFVLYAIALLIGYASDLMEAMPGIDLLNGVNFCALFLNAIGHLLFGIALFRSDDGNMKKNSIILILVTQFITMVKEIIGAGFDLNTLSYILVIAYWLIVMYMDKVNSNENKLNAALLILVCLNVMIIFGIYGISKLMVLAAFLQVLPLVVYPICNLLQKS